MPRPKTRQTLGAMKPETVENAKAMLVKLLKHGASYSEAGRPFGLGRSTVERNVKALLRDMVETSGIEGLDEDELNSFALVRKASSNVLAELEHYQPGFRRPLTRLLTEADLDHATARLRRCSQNPCRDMALVALLYQTGAKPAELARLEVRDVMTPGGAVRINWHLRSEATINGLGRPLHLSSAVVRSALDVYLAERVNQRAGTRGEPPYRGLDPCSALFLTGHGGGFPIIPRSASDPRETCPLMTATLRLAFRRAGWAGLTAQVVRRMVASRLAQEGQSIHDIARVLGMKSERGARILVDSEREHRGSGDAAIEPEHCAPPCLMQPAVSAQMADLGVRRDVVQQAAQEQ